MKRWLVPAGITLALTAGLAVAARRSFRSVTPLIHREAKGKKDSTEPKEGIGPGSSGTAGRSMAGVAGMGEKGSQKPTSTEPGSWTDKWFSRLWLGPSQEVLDNAMLDQFEMEDYSGGEGDYK